MYGKLSMQPLTEMNITGTKLVRESAGFDKSREHVQVVSRDKFVEASYYERYFVVHYNYGTTSTLFSMWRRFTMTALRQSTFPA